MTIPNQSKEKRLAELKKQVPTRGMERYPSILKNLSDLPIELQSPAVSSLATGEAIQTIISFPPQIHHGWDYVPKQALLFMRGDVIHIQASIWPNEMPKVIYITGSDLLYLKVKLLLLYGHLEVVAQGLDSPARLAMEFNTVSWNYLSQPLHKLLRCTESTSGTPMDVIGHSKEIQEAFDRLPFKFANGVKLYGLLPGQQIQELVFQPASWKRQFHFFGQAFAGNLLVMLTTDYLVVIQEELKVNQGWILTYIPLGNIALIQNQPAGVWNELIVQLKRGNQPLEYKLLLKNETAEAWRERWIEHGGHWQDLSEQVV